MKLPAIIKEHGRCVNLRENRRIIGVTYGAQINFVALAKIGNLIRRIGFIAAEGNERVKLLAPNARMNQIGVLCKPRGLCRTEKIHKCSECLIADASSGTYSRHKKFIITHNHQALNRRR